MQGVYNVNPQRCVASDTVEPCRQASDKLDGPAGTIDSPGIVSRGRLDK